MDVVKYFSLFAMYLPKIGRKTLGKILYEIDKENVDFEVDDCRKIDKFRKFALSVIAPAVKHNFDANDIEIAHNKMLQVIDMCEKLNIYFIGTDDSKFPKKLKNIPDAPLYLFYKGDISIANNRPNIAVIGTRQPTSRGIKVGRRFGEILAEKEIVVVSGLAVGCDTAGHLGCISKNGTTIAVMAGGLDEVYPAQNQLLAKQIVDDGGCLISEYPPGHRPFRSDFVDRDRLQSGLSSGIIVVETGVKGGTMHTVEFARLQGKQIGAFYQEGAVFAKIEKVQGNLKLIKSKTAVPLSSSSELNDFIEKCMNDSQEKKTVPSAVESNRREYVPISLF